MHVLARQEDHFDRKERNVYFDNTQLSVSRLEGEEWELTETKTHNPPVLPIPEPEIPQIIPEIPQKKMKIILSPKYLPNMSVNRQ